MGDRGKPTKLPGLMHVAPWRPRQLCGRKHSAYAAGCDSQL